jgi:hypothetical protein
MTTKTNTVTLVPSPGRLAIQSDDYPGLDPEWRELWNKHGSSMVRADEVSIDEYRADPAKYSFTYPTYPGISFQLLCPKTSLIK